MAAEAGRDAESLPVSVFGASMDGDELKRFRDAGIQRVVFSLQSAKSEEILPVLDQITALKDSLG